MPKSTTRIGVKQHSAITTVPIMLILRSLSFTLVVPFKFSIMSARSHDTARRQKHDATEHRHEGNGQHIGTGQKTSRSEKNGSDQSRLSRAADHDERCGDDEGQ